MYKKLIAVFIALPLMTLSSCIQNNNLNENQHFRSSSTNKISSSSVDSSSSELSSSVVRTSSSSLSLSSNIECYSDGFMINYNGGYLTINEKNEDTYTFSYLITQNTAWSIDVPKNTPNLKDSLFIGPLNLDRSFSKTIPPFLTDNIDSAHIRLFNLNLEELQNTSHTTLSFRYQWDSNPNNGEEINLYCYNKSIPPDYTWNETTKRCTDTQGNEGLNQTGWPIVYKSKIGECMDLTLGPFQYNRWVYDESEELISFKGSKHSVRESTLEFEKVNGEGSFFIDPTL
jgi:hypothetical protein